MHNMDTLTPDVIKMKRKYYVMYFIVLLAAISCTMGAPTTRPLEHSPSDLAWDAWLKHGHRQDAIPPRRITTKSLFVFPNFGEDSLPACAEGYRPDALGRCVKVVKVNESAHLEFLLQKLNSQFATDTRGENESDEVYDYDIETDTSDGSGPFQVNIPLALANTGHKSDENQPGEFVVLSKKGSTQHSSTQTHKAPTSSPEVVPDSPNVNSQFFPGGLPAETQNVLLPSNKTSPGGLSILLRNSTNVGLTLLIPSNGKIEAVSESNNVEKPVVIEDTNNKYADESTEESTEKKEETISTTAESQPVEETTHKRIPLPHPLEEITVNSEKKRKDELTEQIESLKMRPALTSVHQPNPSIPLSHPYNANAGNPKPTNEDIDIEEKIKIISKFADVSRNSGEMKDISYLSNKRPSSNMVRFPDDQIDYSNYGKPLDLLPVPSMPIELPVNIHGMPIPQNSVYNVHPPSSYEKFQPLHYDKNFNSEENNKNKPQWLPYGWNIHGNHNGEQNLIDFWSRLSMLQRYPYNVRFHQEQRPTQYPSLYPSSRESGSRLNVRHTAVNYRQGREDVLGRRRLYEDESMNYKRSHHPHFRDSEELSHTMQAYNGR